MRAIYTRAMKPTALAMLLLAAAVGAHAQGGGSSAAPVASKVGTLNVRQAIVATAEGKQASAELQSQFSARQTDLDNVRKQIEDLQNRLRNGERTLSEDEKARLTRQGELLSRQYQRRQDELQEELNAAQAEVIDRIWRKMQEVLDRYARENGYSLVFDISGQNSPVIYNAGQTDLTPDLIRLYDQAYPVKGATPTPAPPKPAQPKPTPPPAAKKPSQ